MTEAIKDFVYPAYTFGIDRTFGAAFDSGWQAFPGHYLLYAATGVFRLEVGQAQWLLPPQRAAWVAAGVPLRLSAAGPGTTSSVLFGIDTIPQPAFTCRVFGVSSLAREMLLYAARWGHEREHSDPHAETFFRALAAVCAELAGTPDEFWLPRAHSAELGQALDYTLEHLADQPTFAQVAEAVHLSARTLARRFGEETGMTWSQFAHRARMLRAMELLANPAAKIVAVVDAVGFSSISAFNRAFRVFTGETPSGYRRRLRPM